MKIVGYARVSTTHQQLDSQIYALESFGCDIIFKEHESGRLNNRSQLSQALESLSPGDTFVIFKLDRLSRGTKHLLSLMEFFNENQINFISIQNNIDTSTSIGKFFFTIMSAFAEMEADLIRERVISGLQAAKENGVTLGIPVKNKNIEQVIDQYLYTDKSITQIAIENDISRPTVYRYLKTRNLPLRPTKEKQATRIK